MDRILTGLLGYVVLLFSITWHECAHALAASWCGDETPRGMGRVTLNPLPHMDFFGTLLIPLFNIFSPGSFMLVGWGRPVLVNPRKFRHEILDDVLVALAGPFSNILLLLASLLSLRLLPLMEPGYAQTLFDFLILPFAATNLMLAFFNLLPIPPLDGSHLIFYLLPESAKRQYGKICLVSAIGMLVLINTPLWNCFSAFVFKLLPVGMHYIGGIPR